MIMSPEGGAILSAMPKLGFHTRGRTGSVRARFPHRELNLDLREENQESWLLRYRGLGPPQRSVQVLGISREELNKILR